MKTSHTAIAFLIIIALILTAACAGKESTKGRVYTTPQWYGKPSQSSSTIVGYGSALSLSEADRKAWADISQQIEVWIESTITSRTTKKGLSGDVSVDEYVEQRIQSRSQNRLSNHERTRKETSGNRYFVQWTVDLRPEWQQLADSLLESWRSRGELVPEELNWTGPRGYTSSQLAAKVERYIEGQGAPGVSKTLQLGLFRRHGRWNVRAGEIIQPIQDLLFAVNFTPYEVSGVHLDLVDIKKNSLGHRLSAGQHFYLRAASPKKMEFSTLFNIYADGRVCILNENAPLDSGKTLFPKGGSIFSAATLEDQKVSLDVYMVVCTSSRQNLAQFHLLDQKNTLATGSSAYTIDDIIHWLGRTDVQALDTTVVQTKED